jgi:hypothetical protein
LEATRKAQAAKAISFHRRRSMAKITKSYVIRQQKAHTSTMACIDMCNVQCAIVSRSIDVANVDIVQRAKQEENAKIAKRMMDDK